MKSSIPALIFLLFALSANAQTTNRPTQEQLNLALVKAKNLKKTGAVISITGCLLDITGIVLLATSPVNGTTTGIFYRERETYAWRGGGVLLAGAILSIGGIPPWIIGGIKKTHIDNKLISIKPVASINGIGLTIRF